MKGTNYNPFVNEYFIGFINQVTPQGVKVHFPSSALLQPFFKYGELYHGGLVGNYVVIEGHQMGFLGKIQGIELPEKERLELSEKSFETNEMHPIGYIEILLSFSFENPEEIQRGLNSLPPIGAKVFVCASDFIQSFFKRFGVKKENAGPCLMKLGVLTQDKETPVEISLDALFGRHCAIVGTTGGGKSYTTSKLLEGISNAGAKAIIIDPTGEYSGFDSKDYIESAIINKDSYFHYSRLSVGDWFALFRPAGQVQQPILLEAIKSLKLVYCLSDYANIAPDYTKYINKVNANTYKIKENTILIDKERLIKKNQLAAGVNNAHYIFEKFVEDQETSHFNINALPMQLHEECYKLYGNQWSNTIDERTLGNVSSLIIRIQGLVKNSKFNSIFGFNKIQSEDNELCIKIESFLADDTKHILRIGFEEVPYDFQTREILANAIAKFLLNKARKGDFKTRPVVFFVDEAHQFLNKEVKDEYFQSMRLDSFDSIAKECRKYGLFLCLATQMPRDIPLGTLSQMGTFLVHRLINYKDKEAVESACSTANKSTLAYLPVLGAGEVILMGVDFPMPVMLKVDLPQVEPNSNTPPFKRI